MADGVFPLEDYRTKYPLPSEPDDFARAALELMDRAEEAKADRKEVAWAISYGCKDQAAEHPQLRKAGNITWDIGEAIYGGGNPEIFGDPDKMWSEVRQLLSDWVNGKRYPTLWHGTVNYTRAVNGKVVASISGAVRAMGREVQVRAAQKDLLDVLKGISRTVSGSEQERARSVIENAPEILGEFKKGHFGASEWLEMDLPPFK